MNRENETIELLEKNSPKRLTDIVGQKDVIKGLKELIDNPYNRIPHLLFSGSEGSGKLSTATCVAKELLCDTWKDNTFYLNGSEERDIEKVGQRIKKFTRHDDGDIMFKIAIVDKADYIDENGQATLRRIIEDTSRDCKFIIIAENKTNLIDPLKSRCEIFRFAEVLKEESIGI